MDLEMMQEAQASASVAGLHDTIGHSNDEQMSIRGTSPASTDMVVEGFAVKSAYDGDGYDANEVMMVEEYEGNEDDVIVTHDGGIDDPAVNFVYDDTAPRAASASQSEEVGRSGHSHVAEEEDDVAEAGTSHISDVNSGSFAAAAAAAAAASNPNENAFTEVVREDEVKINDADSSSRVLEESYTQDGVSPDEAASQHGADEEEDQIAADEAAIEERGQTDATRSQAAPQPTISALPVRVTFNEQDFVAFASAEGSSYVTSDDLNAHIPAPSLNIEHSIAHETLDAFFETLRVKDNLGDFLDDGTELTLLFKDLKLTLREDDVYAREVTLDDVQRIHAGLGLQHTPHLIVMESQRFITRYNELANQASTAIESQIEASDPEIVAGQGGVRAADPDGTESAGNGEAGNIQTPYVDVGFNDGLVKSGLATSLSNPIASVSRPSDAASVAQISLHEDEEQVEQVEEGEEEEEEEEREEEEEEKGEDKEGAGEDKAGEIEEEENGVPTLGNAAAEAAERLDEGSSLSVGEGPSQTFTTTAEDDAHESYVDAASEQDYAPEYDESPEAIEEIFVASEEDRVASAEQVKDGADLAADGHGNDESNETDVDRVGETPINEYDDGMQDNGGGLSGGYHTDAAADTATGQKRAYEKDVASIDGDEDYRSDLEAKRSRYEDEAER